MSNREEFDKWYAEAMWGNECFQDGCRIAYQSATLSTAAKYQARINELEEVLQTIALRFETDGMASEALSSTSPDQALQRVVLEARIDEQVEHNSGWEEEVTAEQMKESSSKRLEQLREQLVALEGE